MTDHDLQKIRETVASSIENNVNGKIKVFRQEFSDYVKDDLAWKAEYEPYLKGLANLSGGTKIMVRIFIAVGAIVGALLSIKSFFK